MIIDPDKVANVITEIAEEEIASRFGKLTPDQISEKSSPTDLVTEVDVAMERKLEKALADIYPAATMIGEERATADPTSVDALAGEGAFWIVDPLDGTRNFVHCVEQFGTIVALVENGQTTMGWIYAVPEKKIAIAVRGDGASWSGERIVPAARRGEKAVGWRSIGWLSPEWRSRILPNLKEKLETSSGHCSAYGYLHTALGEIDFKISSRIYPWDHAAGVLLVAETGGTSGYLDDNGPYLPKPWADRPLLVTAAGRDWRRIADVIRDGCAKPL